MSKISKTNKHYEDRQIVAKIGRAGHFYENGRKFAIPEVMTFWGGAGPSTAARFSRIADKDHNGFLILENVSEGEIVVSPGLIYKKTWMTGEIVAEHLKAMKKFRPKDIISYEKETGPAVDLGVIKMKETLQ